MTNDQRQQGQPRAATRGTDAALSAHRVAAGKAEAADAEYEATRVRENHPQAEIAITDEEALEKDWAA